MSVVIDFPTPHKRTLEEVRAEIAEFRARLEREIEDRIELLDFLDGNSDDEPEEEGCPADEDRGTGWWQRGFGPGDPDDGEIEIQ